MIKCSNPECENFKPNPIFLFLKPSKKGLIFEEKWFCSRKCFKEFLLKKLIEEKKSLLLKKEVEFTLRVGDILIEGGLITPEQLKEALRIQRKSGEKIGKIFIEMGILEKDELLKILSKQSGIPYIDVERVEKLPVFSSEIPDDVIKHFNVLPIEFNKESKTLSVVLPNPYDVRILRAFFENYFQGFSVKFFLGDEDKIVKLIHEISPEFVFRELNVNASEERIIDLVSFLKKIGARELNLKIDKERIEIVFKLNELDGLIIFEKRL